LSGRRRRHSADRARGIKKGPREAPADRVERSNRPSGRSRATRATSGPALLAGDNVDARVSAQCGGLLSLTNKRPRRRSLVWTPAHKSTTAFSYWQQLRHKEFLSPPTRVNQRRSSTNSGLEAFLTRAANTHRKRLVALLLARLVPRIRLWPR